jgi:MFS superfamily sulfate permease-like transporter
LICTSIRVRSFEKSTYGLTVSPLYVPIFCFAILSVFWIAAAAGANTNTETLASSGWLFQTNTASHEASPAADWNYWILINFREVEWRVLTTVAGDMSLLLLIGALTLPIFASAAANDLNLSEHNMNHDFMGHGIANIAAGIVGTLPAIIVC